MVATVRTVEAITARREQSDDMFGYTQEALRHCVDNYDETTIRSYAVTYLGFAWTEALRHRGQESQRSVVKLDVLCWVLGNDATFAEPISGLYGVASLVSVADFLGVEFPPEWRRTTMALDGSRIQVTEPERVSLIRMSNNEPCFEGCGECKERLS